jgi:LuxR family maltose regulon positive regulatory protein
VLGPARALYRSDPSPFLRSIVDHPVASAPPRAADGLAEQLTEREYMVLRLLPTRLSNDDIAAELGISLNTVKTHLKHIYRKLGAEGRSRAVASAERLHLL